MENVILSPLPLIALKQELREIIREELCIARQQQEADRMLSAEQACNLFNPKICKATLVNWSAKNRLKQYRIGRRVFYKYSEIISSLQVLKKYKRE